MKNYYISKQAQPNGDHELHLPDCTYLPDTENRIYLGEFHNYHYAIIKAQKQYSQVNGCFYCLYECHSY